MIIVADVNTIWRAKPFRALADLVPVTALRPRDPRVAWREHLVGESPGGGFGHPVLLPPSWASRTARVSQRWLWRRALALAGRQEPQGLMVTSPHYVPLARRVAGTVPVYYYCSDDYRSYDGWGGARMAAQESELVGLATHSFFVSHALAQRAIRDYGCPPERVSISMNATDPAFLAPPAEQTLTVPAIRALRRPLVGVVGGVSARLDWGLLRRLVDQPGLGTLLFVGPTEASLEQNSHFRAVRAHPRSVFVGQRPHGELPAWMRALDVALIPYVRSPINHHCSPMRLFDHLASGRPIVATDACEQVCRFSRWVAVEGDAEAFVAQVMQKAAAGIPTDPGQVAETAHEHLWRVRAQRLAAAIGAPSRVVRPAGKVAA